MVDNVDIDRTNRIKQEAWKLISTGQTEKAKQIATELYDSGFADAELTYLIGCCAATLNHYPEAIDFFNESLTYDSTQENRPYTYIALGTATGALNSHDISIKHFEDALRINPNLAEAYLGIGDACEAKGDIDLAENNYVQASRLNPTSGQPYYQLGHIQKQRDNGEQAIKYFQKAVEREPDVPDYQIWLGDTLLKLQHVEEAKKVSSKALKLSPLNEIALGTYSAACARLGDYEKAHGTINIALQKDFLITDVAVAFLTICKHVKRCDEAIDYAKRCLSPDNLAERTKRNLQAQLALALDYCERYDEAWHYISECKRYKFALEEENYPVKFKLAIDNFISAFTPATRFSAPASTAQHDHVPIFIVGMPRSGTSLVEQILAAHPDVAACGELPVLNDIINEFSTFVKSDKNWPFSVNDMDKAQVDQISREYMKRLPAIEKKAIYVTDKMPHNFFALGLIELLFPNAKIIHCRRQPLDTCISIYFANFHVGHEYSGNLFDLGAHYFQYLRLMEHWRHYLSTGLYEIDYEALVNDPEPSIRALLDYCGLAWDENCLNFNRLKRHVKTASFDQVKQPIHTRSIDRWKHYEKYLDNLKSGLERGY